MFDEFLEPLQGWIYVVKLLECFASENMDASKIVDQFVLELLRAVDVDVGALLVKGHGLEHPLGLGCVVPFGMLKHFRVARDPWIKIIT